jgi:hypothetical protein
MTPLKFDVELETDDKSGESKLYLTIKNTTTTATGRLSQEVFERLVPAKAYVLTIDQKGSAESSGTMYIDLVGEDQGAGNG